VRDGSDGGALGLGDHGEEAEERGVTETWIGALGSEAAGSGKWW